MAKRSQRCVHLSLWFAVAVCLTPSAGAITVLNDADISSQAVYYGGSADGVDLSGVVSINIQGVGGCSGALLADGTSILTAAHCVSSGYGNSVTPASVTVYFQSSNGLASYNTVASIAVDPNWNGTATNGGDLAVIQLGQLAPAFATGYQLDLNSALYGVPDVIAGYGYSGTGATGYDSTDYPYGTLRAGENEFVENGYTFGNSFNPPADPAWSSGLLIGQFYESGNPSTNVLGTQHPFSASDEVDIAPGDSGGPAFQDVNGTYEIVGVNDLIVCVTAGCTPNSSFGEVFGDTSVSANLGFIEAAEAIPEPRTFSLILGALLASFLLRGRGSEPV